MIDLILGKLFPPKMGSIETSDWFRAQAIEEGTLKTYAADDVCGSGYRVLEWGFGRHRKPTKEKRKYAEMGGSCSTPGKIIFRVF